MVQVSTGNLFTKYMVYKLIYQMNHWNHQNYWGNEFILLGVDRQTELWVSKRFRKLLASSLFNDLIFKSAIYSTIYMVLLSTTIKLLSWNLIFWSNPSEIAIIILPLKACILYFFFLFLILPKKSHLKSSFRSWHIHIFVIFSPSFPQFSDWKSQMKLE